MSGGRWFHASLAGVIQFLAAAGFLPALLDPSVRRGPVTPLVAFHAVAVTDRAQ